MIPNLQQAAQAIRTANSVVLAGHVNPDGDALGSMLALTHAIHALNKAATPLSHDGVPAIYRWLSGSEWVEREAKEGAVYDLAILCDTGSLSRVGGARGALEGAARSICIDHHAKEGDFGDVRVVCPQAAATGEIVYALLREMSVPITRTIAECLMCAIITDTGSFRFMNVTANTLHVAASLMGAGVSPAHIGELVFDSREVPALKLLGRALDSLRVSPCGRVAWATITASDFADVDGTDEQTEGIVTHIRAVKGVRVGFLMREIPGKKIRVSLRSREGFDVNHVAQEFGGGGHRMAAGCTLAPPLRDAEQQLLDAIARWME